MLNTIVVNGSAVPQKTVEGAFEYIPGSPSQGLLILCDHASNTFPEGYATLGLPPSQLERHIAYDIGVAGVTRHLAGLLGAPALLTRYSRLLIDPNRGEDDPTLVMRLSDGAVVPGNAAIDAEEIARRIALYHKPYHQAIDITLDKMTASGRIPAVFSIHSFTENWRGWLRPWHATILWDRDPRMAKPMLAALRAEPGLVIGENEPYSGGMKGDCMYRHATARGLAHVLIEIRQDLIRDEAGQAQWAERLARILRRLLGNPRADTTFHSIRYYGSKADGNGNGNGASVPADAIHEEDAMKDLDPQVAAELEAAAFRKLVAHLRERADVQNIDMMTLAGFCRNCLSNWYREAAEERGIALSKDESREIIYGMPYDEWKAKHQAEADPEQRQRFAETRTAGGH